MVRSLYRAVLRLHPPFFRQRFTDEMQSIFDHAPSRTVAFALFIDALLSLARQWTLRSAYWEEPVLASSHDAPALFLIPEGSRPSTIANAVRAARSLRFIRPLRATAVMRGP